MHIRKNAANLTADERAAVLSALYGIKHTQASGAPAGVSIYDRFVATHAAVMEIRTASWPTTVNMGHWNIGFLPWHREFLRRFELELRNIVPEATLPYWHWTDHDAAVTEVFTPEFMGELTTGEISDGVFRLQVPSSERPPWWPSSAEGWPVRITRSGNEEALRRLNSGSSWPSAEAEVRALVEFTERFPDFHTAWVVWMGIEAGLGSQGFPQLTHNSGHNFIGGNMSDPMFSPNDPMFWLHHANVDRLWHVWQTNMLTQHGGSHNDHYPPPSEANPWNGSPVPPGHRRNDEMWPWVDDPSAYIVESFDGLPHQAHLHASLLPVGGPRVTPSGVLDITTLDYAYEPPEGPSP